MTEQRYALIRVSKGDYLLPSNDGTTLWRLSSYDEDGNAEWMDGLGNWHELRGTFWQTAKYGAPLVPGQDLAEDFLEWEHWTVWETTLKTRRDAIAAALR